MKVHALDLTLLSTFVAIVETGSFGRAAERVARGPSAVSMQMRRLEERLDTRLLDRNAHAVALTEDGHRLFPYAKSLVEMSEEARAMMSDAGLSGKLRVGVPEWFGNTRLQGVLARFMRSHPNVHLNVRADASTNLREGVARGELDMALAIVDPADTGEHAVHSERLLWVVGRNHAPRIGEEMPLALFEPPCPYRDLAIGELERFGWRWRETFTSSSVATVRNAVEARMGLSVFPESAVTDELRVLGETDGFPRLPNTHLAIYDNRRQQSATMAAAMGDFVDCVRELTRLPT